MLRLARTLLVVFVTAVMFFSTAGFVAAKKTGGGDLEDYFCGWVYGYNADGSIKGPLEGATVTCTYWAGHYEQIQTTTTDWLGWFLLDPKYVSNSGYYELAAGFPGVDQGGYWKEVKTLSLPTVNQLFVLHVNRISDVMHVQNFFTGGGPTDAVDWQFTTSTTNTWSAYAYLLPAGISVTHTSTYLSGYGTTEAGCALQVHQPFYTTGIFRGSGFDLSIVASWAYGGPQAPLEINTYDEMNADPMPRPDNPANQIRLAPNGVQSLPLGVIEGESQKMWLGVTASVGAFDGTLSMKVLDLYVDLANEGDQDIITFTLRNMDSDYRWYEWFIDGFVIHIWKFDPAL